MDYLQRRWYSTEYHGSLSVGRENRNLIRKMDIYDHMHGFTAYISLAGTQGILMENIHV